MMFKKLFGITTLFLLLSSLMACAEPEPTPVPTAMPEIEPTPTEEVTEPDTSQSSIGSKWCANTDIVFFAGGPDPEAPFTVYVYNGAVAAAEDLGANVEYMFSDWSPENMVSQFVEAAETNPDGIAIMGHPGDAAFAAVVDQAQEDGIIVTSQNTSLPKLEAIYKSDGFGYVGAENYSAGYALGTESVRRFDLKADDKALILGVLVQAERGDRTQGVIDALQETGVVVDFINLYSLVELGSGAQAEDEALAAAFVDYVAENPDLKLLVTDVTTHNQNAYFEAAGLEPGEVYGAGFDLSPETTENVRAGWTHLVLDQQPWLQGYLPILQLCLAHNYGFSGLHVDTGAGFAHTDNIELLADLVEESVR